MSKTTNKFSPEVRERAVRLVLDQECEHPSRWAAITSIAAMIGCSGHTLLEWVKKAEVNSGKRGGVPAEVADRLKALERENRSCGRLTRSCVRLLHILPRRSSTAHSSDDRFIDEHRGEYGVEPICRVLPIAPSTYHERVAQGRDPSRLSPRAQRDEAMKVEVRRVFDANFKVYGVRKVWRQMQREGFDIACCTVERLMRDLGLQGVIRGKPVKTTVSDNAAPCPLDQVNRQFHAPAPTMLWVSDCTYVATWVGGSSTWPS